MKLESVKCSWDQPNKWQLDEFTLSPINLLVGKNATGKTSTINLIRNIANLVCGDSKQIFMSGHWELTFLKDSKKIRYELKYENTKIITEKYYECGNADIWLDRQKNGDCKIYAVKERKLIDFHVADTELACVSRRDRIQHPFFMDLYEWGNQMLCYNFGTDLGKNSFAVFLNDGKDDNPSLKDQQNLVRIFRLAVSRYKNDFKNKIFESMKALGYLIQDIEIGSPNMTIGIAMVGEPASSLRPTGISPVGLYVKESDLNTRLFQSEISQGMFRCLSLFVQLHYAQMSSTSSLVLIDDIGEGLDFERSVSLIEQIIKIANESKIQLVMSTNDRFVMNKVPLEHWCVIQRKRHCCKIFNYANSQKIFDAFAFTGLSNFDFLSTDFISEKDFLK